MPRSRQIAVIMFTDIVGYTALMGKDESLALQILAKNKSLHQRLLKRFDGKFLKEMGDGILASFPSVTDAVYCASTLLNETSGLEELKLRIGIHLGEVVVEGKELYGDGVNIASRIEGIAEGGQLLVSETIYKNIKNRQGIETSYLGEHILKNVDEPVRVYSVNVKRILDPYLVDKKSKVLEHKAIPFKYLLGFVGVFVVFALVYFLGFQDTKTVDDQEIPEKSIAVLPFADMSPEQDQAYLGDGIAEEILNMLGSLEGVKVIARTSSFQFKGKNVDLREVGEKLGVNYVVEGSVRKFGDQLRVTAQLISSRDGSHLWSNNWDRAMDDINSPVMRLLGLWDQWYDYIYQELEKNPDMCIYYLLTVNEGQKDIDPAFYDIVLPIRNHPKYPSLLESQRKRYEENVRKFSVKGRLVL